MHQHILDTIGGTPLVRINRIRPGNKRVTIVAKVEGSNPGGSVKDRVALAMIREAERSGELRPGKTIIEATSGNTGISLAMIGAVLGYGVTVVMSEAVSEERRRMIAAFGARLVLTPGSEGTDGAIRRARAMVRESPGEFFHPDQFSNEHNRLAHYRTTAEELWQQSGGSVTHFVAAIGTSGTLMGVGSALKDHDPSIAVFEAHPVRGHYIQGLKNMEEAIVPALYDPSLLDGSIMVSTEDAYAMARRLAREEGIFVGMSSGAAMVAALEVASRIDEGVVATIFPDRGEKYLSTGLFAPD